MLTSLFTWRLAQIALKDAVPASAPTKTFPFADTFRIPTDFKIKFTFLAGFIRWLVIQLKTPLPSLPFPQP